MRAIVDQNTCIGCGLCPSTCPDVFRMEETEKAFAYADPVPEDQEECCRSAADDCPVEAIAIEK